MRIALHELRQAGPGSSREATAEEDFSELSSEDVSFDQPVTVRVRVVHADESMYAEVSGDTTVALQCDRCLQSYRQDLHFETGEPFIEEGDEAAADGLTYRNDVLDTHDLTREELLLALPVRGLCRDNCRGLCPQCGHNLNEGACACVPQHADDRWSALQQWRDSGRERPQKGD